MAYYYPATGMDFRILGPVEVWEGGRSLPLGGTKQRALLAILLTQAKQVVASERLIDLIWPGEPPETAGHSLQVYVSQLRKVLEPKHKSGAPYTVLVSQHPGYLVRIEADDLDLGRFLALVEEGRQSMSEGAPDVASSKFREALGLWRSQALADFASQPFAVNEIARLTELRLRALEDRIDADLALGRHADLASELESLVADHPLRERLSGQLMLSLYRSGRQAEASNVYQMIRARLVEELGMEPGAELQTLLKQILKHDPVLDLTLHDGTSSQKLGNLPRQLSSFVGRTSEIEQLRNLTIHNPLVSLVGPGGIGKTRLCLELASQMRGHFEDGAWWVELAAVGDPTLLRSTVARALRIRERADLDLLEVLIGRLESRQLLLILDNCEHLIDDVSSLVGSLLKACPQVTVLATSREPLGIGGERVFRVSPLTTPSLRTRFKFDELVKFESVALFCDRALLAVDSLQLTDTQANVLVTVCNRLDGIPLAIELAAAKSKALTLEQIADKLEHRFDLLTGGGRTLLPRQQTLRATIDWSYGLLDESEKVVFRRLAVFPTSFTLEAAETIASDGQLPPALILENLTQLIDKSLVFVDRSRAHPRFGMLDTIRKYALDRLIESTEEGLFRNRHAIFFSELAKSAGSSLDTAREISAISAIEPDLDNLRIALDYTRQPELRLALARNLARFLVRRGQDTEARGRLATVLRSATGKSAERAAALVYAACLEAEANNVELAYTYAADALTISRNIKHAGGIREALFELGRQAFLSGDFPTALAHLEKMSEEVGESDEGHTEANRLNGLAVTHTELGHYADAEKLLEQGESLARKLGNPTQIADASNNRALLSMLRGQLTTASLHNAKAIRLFMQIGDQGKLALCLELEARIAARQGQLTLAKQLLQVSSDIRAQIGAPVWEWWKKKIETDIANATGATRRGVPTAAPQDLRLTLDEAIDHALARGQSEDQPF